MPEKSLKPLSVFDEVMNQSSPGEVSFRFAAWWRSRGAVRLGAGEHDRSVHMTIKLVSQTAAQYRVLIFKKIDKNVYVICLLIMHTNL